MLESEVSESSSSRGSGVINGVPDIGPRTTPSVPIPVVGGGSGGGKGIPGGGGVPGGLIGGGGGGGGIVLGVPIPGGGTNVVVNPFPGSGTIICAIVPIPPTFLLQGGGINTALTPVGFNLHDLSS